MSRHALVLGLCLVAVAAPVARAQPPPLTAAQRDGERKAQAAFAAGRYEESVEIYANLWAEYHDPIYLRNIGRCYQKLRNLDRAIGSFEEYLAKARRLGAGERQEVEGYLRELRALKQQRDAEARGQAAAPPAAAEPAPAVPVPAAPAASSLPPAATAGGSLPAAPLAPAAITPPAVSETAPPLEHRGPWRRVAFGTLIGAGALAAAGGVFLWSSWSRYGDANHRCDGPTACDAAAEAIKTRNWTSRFLFLGAAVAAAAGGTMLYLHPAPEPGHTAWVVGAARTF